MSELSSFALCFVYPMIWIDQIDIIFARRSREQSKSENVEFNYGNYSALVGRLRVNRSSVMWWCRSCKQLISYEQPTLNASSMVLKRSDDDERRRRHKCWKQFRNHNQKLHHTIIINRRLIPLHSLLHAFPRPIVQSSDLLRACMCNFLPLRSFSNQKFLLNSLLPCLMIAMERDASSP